MHEYLSDWASLGGVMGVSVESRIVLAFFARQDR